PHANAQQIGHKDPLRTKVLHGRLVGLARLEQVGDQNGVERICYCVEIIKDRQSDKVRFIRTLLHDADDFDAVFDGAERRDLCQIGLTNEQHFFDAARPSRLEQIGAIGLGLAKKAERVGKIVDRKARLFGKSLRREVVGVSSSWSAADLDQTLLDTPLEIGVDETESDAELGSE